MARAHNPFGDGKASSRILDACRGFLNERRRARAEA
jgi:UDP-N-acetylglucosamine 2-epimerase